MAWWCLLYYTSSLSGLYIVKEYTIKMVRCYLQTRSTFKKNSFDVNGYRSFLTGSYSHLNSTRYCKKSCHWVFYCFASCGICRMQSRSSESGLCNQCCEKVIMREVIYLSDHHFIGQSQNPAYSDAWVENQETIFC